MLITGTGMARLMKPEENGMFQKIPELSRMFCGTAGFTHTFLQSYLAGLCWSLLTAHLKK